MNTDSAGPCRTGCVEVAFVSSSQAHTSCLSFTCSRTHTVSVTTLLAVCVRDAPIPYWYHPNIEENSGAVISDTGLIYSVQFPWCKTLLPFYFCSLECAFSWHYSHYKELIASFECLSSLWSYWFKIVVQVHSYEVNLYLFICLKPVRIYSVLSVLINVYWMVSHSQLRPRVRNVSDEPQLTIFLQLTHHFIVSRKMKWNLADVETWVLASVTSCFAVLASTSSRNPAPPWCLVCLLGLDAALCIFSVLSCRFVFFLRILAVVFDCRGQ